MIKIIEEKPKKKYIGRCSECHSLIECEDNDVDFYSQDIACPVCYSPIKKDTMEFYFVLSKEHESIEDGNNA